MAKYFDQETLLLLESMPQQYMKDNGYSFSQSLLERKLASIYLNYDA